MEMMVDKLFRIMDGALLARHDEETGHLLVWYGGHSIHIVDPQGESAMASIGPYNRPITKEEAEEVIGDWLENHEYMQLTNWLEGGM